MINYSKRRDVFRGKNVVITGGSSGIGLAIAEEFAKMGSNLFLLARKLDRLYHAQERLKSKFSNASVLVFSCDVTDFDHVQQVMEEIGNNHNGIHTLINNAGIISCARFSDTPPEQQELCMKVNYFGSVNCTKAAWPYLIKSGNGHIGFVSSVAGYLGIIGYSSYSPSKFALTGLAECLRMEVSKYNIGVTIIYPPDTDTAILEYEREYGLPETKAINNMAKVLSPTKVANKFVRGILKSKFDVYCNFESRLYRIVRILLPVVFLKQLDRLAANANRNKNH